jgi:hypothetical protein
MRTFTRCAAALGLVALGYALGASGVLSPQRANAQVDPAAAAGVSDAAREKIKAANEAVSAALSALKAEKLYAPATTGLNAFAASVGGVDVITDLETGRGVDPETFAALYAGLATEEVAKDLAKDDEGRVTYKNKVVRMYPISRLKRLFAQREAIVAEKAGAKPAP